MASYQPTDHQVDSTAEEQPPKTKNSPQPVKDTKLPQAQKSETETPVQSITDWASL